MTSDRRLDVLLIEDDPDYALLVGMHLADACGPQVRYSMESAETLGAGLELLATRQFDVVLLDLMLPDGRGVENVSAVRERAPGLPVVVLTTLNDEELGLQAIARGAQDFLSKERLGPRELKRAIGFAAERCRLLAELETVIEGSPEGMLLVDRGGQVLFANSAAAAFFGRRRSELLGRPFAFPLRPGPMREIRSLDGSSPRIGQLRVAEIDWRKDKALLACIQDITELRALERLRAEISERKRLDALKDQFLSTVSHELRSPLTVVKAAIANLWDGLAGELSKPQAQMVFIARRNMERLARIINNLLDLSRLESGRASVRVKDVDLVRLIDEAVLGAGLIEPKERVEVATELPPRAPRAAGDADILSQVLQNLLDNALRYAKRRVLVRLSGDASGELRVSVEDDGPGIPQERLPDLFNKFVQVNRPDGGGGYKGTGLGLAICAESLRLSGGAIWAENREGGGARFTFSVPVWSGDREVSRKP